MAANEREGCPIRIGDRLGSRALLSPYSLRDGQREFTLFEGDTPIGRGADCVLVLAGGMVSRRHAIVRISGKQVMLTDLGSRNGTSVNGRKVYGTVELQPSDRVLIGTVELQLVERSTSLRSADLRRQAQTISFESVRSASDSAPTEVNNNFGDDEADTCSANTFDLLSGVVDKLLALKKVSEAVRLLEGPIVRIWVDAKEGRPVDQKVADNAAAYAVQLAEATGDDQWIVKALDIFTTQERPLPLPVIDQLYTVLRRLPKRNRRALDAYVEGLQARRDTLSAAERFALKRLEGLIRIAAL